MQVPLRIMSKSSNNLFKTTLKMDRNSITGVILIVLIVIGYNALYPPAINVENDKAFTFTFADVETRADELDTADNSKEDLKASAKAKLIAGENLTEEEANILVGV